MDFQFHDQIRNSKERQPEFEEIVNEIVAKMGNPAELTLVTVILHPGQIPIAQYEFHFDTLKQPLIARLRGNGIGQSLFGKDRLLDEHDYKHDLVADLEAQKIALLARLNRALALTLRPLLNARVNLVSP